METSLSQCHRVHVFAGASLACLPIKTPQQSRANLMLIKERDHVSHRIGKEKVHDTQ
jgi:hypothetical protein